MQITTIGLDIAKNVFLRRGQVPEVLRGAAALQRRTRDLLLRQQTQAINVIEIRLNAAFAATAGFQLTWRSLFQEYHLLKAERHADELH